MYSSKYHKKLFFVHILITATSEHLPLRMRHHVMLFYSTHHSILDSTTTRPSSRAVPLIWYSWPEDLSIIIESESEPSTGLNLRLSSID